jgi:hypothetical protein
LSSIDGVTILCSERSYRLEDVIHYKNRLFLVFEFIDYDLKKYIDSVQNDIDPMLVKVL